MSDADDKKSTLQGRELTPGDRAALRDAIAKAVDYRGDVTVRCGGGRDLTGYVFDHRPQADPPVLRMVLAENSERVTVGENEIEAIRFTGRDPAAGKSWENWVRKYAEKKARGEAANEMGEPLDG